MNEIFVTGHRNPDTDSIVAAMSYAALRNALGDRQYVAAHLGHISDETNRMLKHFGFNEPMAIRTVRTQVRDLEYDTPPCLSSSVTMDRAWHVMREQRISAVPVVNDDGTLYGMLSAGDIATFSMETLVDSQVEELPVFNLVLMLNFFRQVPTALEEAALIDGAGHLRTLVQIYLPVSMPAIATITLFCIVSHWNAWFDGMIYITSPSKVPMQTYLRSVLIDMNMADMSADDYELYATLANRTVKCSQIIVATIPILCVYPFLQRYFVSGIVLGSVKG